VSDRIHPGAPVLEPGRWTAPPGETRESLFADLRPLVGSLIRRYGEDPELRQDLRGEIYHRFTVALDRYDPARGIPLRPYLVRQVSASVYTYVRAARRRRTRETSLEPDTADSYLKEVDPTGSWIRALHQEGLRELLPEVLARLPQRQRLVVTARFFDARTFEEIAASLGVRPATVRSLLRHGLNNLRRHLVWSEEGGGPLRTREQE